MAYVRTGLGLSLSSIIKTSQALVKPKLPADSQYVPTTPASAPAAGMSTKTKVIIGVGGLAGLGLLFKILKKKKR